MPSDYSLLFKAAKSDGPFGYPRAQLPNRQNQFRDLRGVLMDYIFKYLDYLSSLAEPDPNRYLARKLERERMLKELDELRGTGVSSNSSEQETQSRSYKKNIRGW